MLLQQIHVIWESEEIICKESRDFGFQKLPLKREEVFWLYMGISIIKQGTRAQCSHVN